MVGADLAPTMEECLADAEAIRKDEEIVDRLE